jgi:hypothetical protein
MIAALKGATAWLPQSRMELVSSVVSDEKLALNNVVRLRGYVGMRAK